MSPLLDIAIIAIGLWVASWVLMVLLAKRLPPGLLRDAAEFLPSCVTTHADCAATQRSRDERRSRC